jgi:hypothetical protein
MTPDREAAIAAIEAALVLLRRPEGEERMHPLPVVAVRLGLVTPESSEVERKAATEFIRRELRHQLPVVRLNRTALVVREESLCAYIRQRESNERRQLRLAEKVGA